MADFNVLADGLRFPEGPAFDSQGRLWAVELEGGSLFRVGENSIERFDVGGMPNGLAFRAGVPWFCDAEGRSIRCLEADGRCSTIVAEVDGVAPDRPNDLAFDRAGNLVFTCPGNSRQQPTGSVWCRRADGKDQKIADGLFFPNGLAFGPDGKTLVIAETYRQRVWKGRWEESTASWIDAEPWACVGGPTGPDGMAFDHAGRLHVAIFGQGVVAIIDSNGVTSDQMAVAGERPTNLAFDPLGGLGLVVSEAAHGRLLSYPGPRGGARLFDGQ